MFQYRPGLNRRKTTVPFSILEIQHIADRVVALGNQVPNDASVLLSVRFKSDKSFVTDWDERLEREVIAIIAQQFPGLPIRAEEQSDKLSEAERLQPLGKRYASIDPVDGTALLVAGFPEWAISVAFFDDGRPVAGIVMQPLLHRAVFALAGAGGVRVLTDTALTEAAWIPFVRKPFPERGIGLDLVARIAKSPDMWEVNRKLMIGFGGHPRNMPAVSAVMELLFGHTKIFVTAFAKEWDLAAPTVLVQEMGGVAEDFAGGPIPWGSVSLPLVLFAESAEVASQARRHANA